MGLRGVFTCCCVGGLLFGLVVTVDAADELARSLILSQGCLGCHQLDHHGGTLGVELELVGARLTADEIRQKLRYPAAKLPTSRMPDYRHLSAAELEALVQFLAALK